MTTKFNDAPGH